MASAELQSVDNSRHTQDLGEFESIFNLAPDLMCVATEDGRFLNVNPASAKILGYTVEEILELGWADLIHPDDLEPTQLEVARQLEGQDTVNFINRYRCKDGSYKFMEWQGTFAENGNLYGVGRDVTARLQAEDRLRAASVYLDVMGEALMVLDAERNVITVNRTALDLWGYDTKEEMLGRDLMDFVPAWTLPKHYAEMVEAVATDSRRSFECAVLARSGEDVPVMVIGSVMKDDAGKPTGFVGVFRDITERKRLEQALTDVTNVERERVRRDLHDGICQELMGLRLIADGLSRRLGEADPVTVDYAGQIKAIAEHAAAAARKIVSELEPLSKDPDALARALRRLIDRVTDLYGITCRLASGEDLLVADADVANQLFLIAQEAIMNAVKHAQPGTIDVSLCYRGNVLELTVTDDGIGLSSEKKSEGMGMRIMQTRATLIGATFDISPGVAGGTLVACTLKSMPPQG